eukprot:TRINITY_DN7871_c0_g1_i1.p2 TRINITY_DN7871_c0_g1~~TRINITY_DN7871_c0_g1_i1.p2  ORF type:complete len:101 (-),score=35.83 TRINITY_DN7871_c0_g1_i1:145-447(-)
MVELLRIIETTGIIFSNSHLQQVSFSNLLEFMSSGDHLPGSSVVVVAEVIGDDGTAANEVIVLVEQKTGPGELSRTCLSMSKTRCGPAERSCAALLVAEC